VLGLSFLLGLLLGLLNSSPFGFSGGDSSPSCDGVEGSLGSPSSSCSIGAPTIPVLVGVESNLGSIAALSPLIVVPPFAAPRPSAFAIPGASDAGCGGEARKFVATAGRGTLDGVSYILGLLCLLGDARGPVPSLRASAANDEPFGLFKCAKAFQLWAIPLTSSGVFDFTLVSLSMPWPPLLRGLRGSVEVARDRRFGLKRAKLALVGDKKDALRLEVWTAFWLVDAGCVFNTWMMPSVVGEILRRFEEDSIRAVNCEAHCLCAFQKPTCTR